MPERKGCRSRSQLAGQRSNPRRVDSIFARTLRSQLRPCDRMMPIAPRTADHEVDGEQQRVLIALHGMFGCDPGERHPNALRRSLISWLTSHGTSHIPRDAWPLLDWLWQFDSSKRACTRASDLDRLSSDGSWTDHVSLWRGDITQVQADAIVNAANSGLTGPEC